MGTKILDHWSIGRHRTAVCTSEFVRQGLTGASRQFEVLEGQTIEGASVNAAGTELSVSFTENLVLCFRALDDAPSRDRWFLMMPDDLVIVAKGDGTFERE